MSADKLRLALLCHYPDDDVAPAGGVWAVGRDVYKRQVWAHEMLFYAGWNDQLTNATALPFLLISSCTNGYFADSYRNAMDEVLLRVSGRGTICLLYTSAIA